MQFKRISDIYRLQNQKKQTLARIGRMIFNINLYKKAGILNEEMNLKYLYSKYRIEPRTLKKHLYGYFFDIGKSKILSFNDSDFEIIDFTLEIIQKFNRMPEKQQELIKMLFYSQTVKTNE